MEGPQRKRAVLEHAVRRRASRLAHRMLRHGDELSGGNAGYPRRRRRSDLSAPRKRNRTIGIYYRQAVRALLAALRASAYRIAEDVEVARQLLYATRSARDGLPAGSHSLPARLGPLSQKAEFHVRRIEGRGQEHRAAARFRAARRLGQAARRPQ